MTVHIVSYNVLVPKLAERPGFYYKCDPRYLDRNYRLQLILSQLHREITHHNNTIICLTELCQTTIPLFENFFRQHNYKLVHKLYGNRSTDYTGLGIAVPNWIRLNSVLFINVGDKIKSVLSQKRLDGWPLWSRIWQDQRGQSRNKSFDSWDIAKNKSNILIYLEVTINGIPLCIGTYHMPCMFKRPDVMLIHAIAIKDLMLVLSKGRNMILTGDFNLQPFDNGYRAITEPGYAYWHMPRSNKYRVHYRPNAHHALRSAYLEMNGTEPPFTALSSTITSPDFYATLDYIFFYGHLQVTKVLPLPKYLDSESYPDATHPSDHLMIAATFRFA